MGKIEIKNKIIKKKELEITENDLHKKNEILENHVIKINLIIIF